MTRATNAHIQAQELLNSFGLDEITDLEMSLFVSGLDAMLIEEALPNCDGKIIFGNTKAVIKVNSNIQFEQRKRFVIAHEIGHLIMHKNIQLPDRSEEHTSELQSRPHLVCRLLLEKKKKKNKKKEDIIQ